MSADTLISETLHQPANAITYQMQAQLEAQFPDKAIFLGESDVFDLDRFTYAGHCTYNVSESALSQFISSFQGIAEGIHTGMGNGWLNIEWQGHRFEFIQVKWQGTHCEITNYWIIADTFEIARDFFYQVNAWCSEVRGEVLVFNNGYWQKDETLFQAIQAANFDNLILPPKLKQEIRDDLTQFFQSRETYERYKIPWKRGVILIGPPGNGKTHTVKALLNSLQVPCLYVKSFKQHYRTDQSSITEVFRRARQTTPCILVLEDLDSLITDSNRSFFLNELDGFASNAGIVALATTNHPERIDSSILDRPSRFDRKYQFELPAPEERAAYLEMWNAQMEAELRVADEGIAEIITLTDGFSFAYLKELFVSSIMRWINRTRGEDMAMVMREQCGLLREQMSSAAAIGEQDVSEDEEEDPMAYLKAVRAMRRASMQ
ncbi:MAG: ATP-binding protein [Chthonomonadales bacterium]